jgi:hypothetical protein
MARWRVDYIGKGGKHLGTVEATDEGEATVPHRPGTAIQDQGDTHPSLGEARSG